MSLNINVNINQGNFQDKVLTLFGVVLQNQNQMTKEMEALVTEVAETKSVMKSALALIEGFGARLDAAGYDPALLNELKRDLDETGNALAKAVTDNTPVVEDGDDEDTDEDTDVPVPGSPILDSEGNPVLDGEGNPTYHPFPDEGPSVL